MGQVSEQTTQGSSPAVVAAVAPGAPRPLEFQFTGTAGEYFRIWIVNTLLTIATLGIYSAWAKVRTQRYFYRNTVVDGNSFDYLAKPLPILRGRLVVAAFLGATVGAQYYSLPLYIGLIIVMTALTPWVAVKSLAFNANNSAYRNIRFAFPARVGEAFGAYLKAGLAYLATCGIGYPWARWSLTRFVAYRHYYGDLPFTWYTKCGAYYRAHILAALMAVPGYAAFMGLIIASATAGKGRPPDPSFMYAPMALFFAFLLIPAAYLKAALANLFYGGLMVGPHYFFSTQRTSALLKLYAVNALAIIVSGGLLIPWAMIRMAQYRAQTLTLMAVGPLHAETLLEERTGALGEGLADLGDFDFGLST